jgi:hypothetical protein
MGTSKAMISEKIATLPKPFSEGIVLSEVNLFPSSWFVTGRFGGLRNEVNIM